MNKTLQQFCQRILPVVQAGAEGKEIEFLSKLTDEWQIKIAGGFDSIHEYRIAQPKATPLPITPEMWAMIDQKYKFAVLTKGTFGSDIVIFTSDKPKFNGSVWTFVNVVDICSSPLAIDTTGIVPELSMTERPNDVAIDNKSDVYGDNGLFSHNIVKAAIEGWINGINTATRDHELAKAGRTKLDGRDRVTTAHINPITGVVQVITTIK